MSDAGINHQQFSNQPDAKTQRCSIETDHSDQHVGLGDREFQDANDEDDSETKNQQNDEVFVPMIIAEVEARSTEYNDDGAASNLSPNELQNLNRYPLATKKRDTADHTSDAETIAELTRKLALLPDYIAKCERLEEEARISLQKIAELSATVDRLNAANADLKATAAQRQRDLKEFKLNPKAMTEQLSTFAANEMASVITGLKTDHTTNVIDEITLFHYTHKNFLGSVCADAVIVKSFWEEVVQKTVELILPDKRQNDDIKHKRELLQRRVDLEALFMATLLEDVLGSEFQWSFSWLLAMIVKQITKSSTVIDILGHVIPGSPSSDVQLANLIKKELSGQKLADESLKLAEMMVDFLLGFDNGGFYGEGSSRQNSESGIVKNPVITLIELFSLLNKKTTDKDGHPIHFQFNVQNSPRNWLPKYAHTPPQIGDLTEEEIAILEQFHLTEIEKSLRHILKNPDFLDRGGAYQMGSSKPAEPPEIGSMEKDENSKRVCPECGYQHALFAPGGKRNCEQKLASGKLCIGVLPTNADVASLAQDKELQQYRDSKVRKLTIMETFTNVIRGHPNAGAREAPVVPAHLKEYELVITSTVLNLEHANPGQRAIQDIVLDRVLHYTGVKDKDTQQPRVFKVNSADHNTILKMIRYYIMVCTDLGASTVHWWKSLFYIHIVPTLHTEMNLMKSAFKLVSASDNEKYKRLYAIYMYRSPNAQSCLEDVGNFHKSKDAINQAIRVSFLVHLSMQALESPFVLSHLPEQPITIDSNLSLISHVIYHKYLCYQPDTSGPNFRNLTDLTLKVLNPLTLLGRSYKEGPEYYSEMMAARKPLTDMAFALGQTLYAPNLQFDTIMMEHLYNGNPAMQQHLKDFFVSQRYEDFLQGVPFKGWCEQIEELVSRWKHCVTSRTHDGFDFGKLMESVINRLREHLYSLVHVTEPDKRQLPEAELDNFVNKMVQFLNFHGPGDKERQGPLSPLTSFDGSEVKPPSNEVREILAEGRTRRLHFNAHFIAHSGTPLPTPLSCLLPVNPIV